MDLSTIKPEVSTVHITNATGTRIGLSVDLLPTSSPKLKSIEHKIRTGFQFKRMRNKTITEEENEAAALEYLSAAVVGWNFTDDATWKGEVPLFTVPKLLEVLRESVLIRTQIDEALGDYASFFKN